MNEIFYRAWHKAQRQMYAVIGMEWSDACPSQLVRLTLHDNLSVKPEEVILMEYSGLTDSNGVLIYEGHVVKYTQGDGEVVKKDGIFQVNHMPLSSLEQCEVTGNVYERKNS